MSITSVFVTNLPAPPPSTTTHSELDPKLAKRGSGFLVRKSFAAKAYTALSQTKLHPRTVGIGIALRPSEDRIIQEIVEVGLHSVHRQV